MLVARGESYKGFSAQTFTDFCFDTNIDSGAPYYIDIMKTSLTSINNYLSNVYSDLDNIIDAYGISDDFTSRINDVKSSIASSFNNMQTNIQDFLGNLEAYLIALNEQQDLTDSELLEINLKLNLTRASAIEPTGSILSDIETGALGFVEGFGQFGEDLVDLGALAGTVCCTPAMFLLDKYQEFKLRDSNVQWDPMVNSMWNDTLNYVKQNDNKWMWDTFYDNTSAGQYLQYSASNFSTARTVGNVAGYVVPAALTAYGGGSAIAAAAPSSSLYAGCAIARANSPFIPAFLLGTAEGSAGLLMHTDLFIPSHPNSSTSRDYMANFNFPERYLNELEYERPYVEYRANLTIDPKIDVETQDVPSQYDESVSDIELTPPSDEYVPPQNDANITESEQLTEEYVQQQDTDDTYMSETLPSPEEYVQPQYDDNANTPLDENNIESENTNN